MRLAELSGARRCPRRLEAWSAGPNRQLLRSHPAIDPEETRNPVAQEGPETFPFVPRSARATGDEPRSLIVGHGSIVVVCRGTDAPSRSTAGDGSRRARARHTRAGEGRGSLDRRGSPAVDGARTRAGLRARCCPLEKLRSATAVADFPMNRSARRYLEPGANWTFDKSKSPSDGLASKPHLAVGGRGRGNPRSSPNRPGTRSLMSAKPPPRPSGLASVSGSCWSPSPTSTAMGGGLSAFCRGRMSRRCVNRP
jgi:hypothetical protein